MRGNYVDCGRKRFPWTMLKYKRQFLFSNMIEVSLYKGNQPFLVTEMVRRLVLTNAKKYYDETSLTSKSIFEEEKAIFQSMHAQEDDETTATLCFPLRIKCVPEITFSDDFVQYKSAVRFEKNMWHLQISKTNLPPDFKNGAYTCSLRLKTRHGFWNRCKDKKSYVNELITVPCSLDLIINDRDHSIQSKSNIKWWTNALWIDFRETFQF
jgi:hypothetical protein